MGKKICLFDFDGVLITQRALEYTALKLLRKDFYRWENVEDLQLIDFAKIFEKATSNNSKNSLIKIYQAYQPYIHSRWRRLLFFFFFNRNYRKYEKIYETIKPGLKDVLISLKKNDFLLGIVSNTSRNRLDYFSEKFNLNKHFSVSISREEVLFRKPHKYPILLAIYKLIQKNNLQSFSKDKTYFVGDLPSDIQSANHAGINSIALLSGHGTREELVKVNPDYSIKSIHELKKLLLK
ncbi:MAG: HAD family hydrolase [Promethearchaeia archaeon]